MPSERAQVIMVWWSMVFLAIFIPAWWGLLKMMPPPGPSLTEAQVGAFYLEHGTAIRWGAMIASWVSAFMVPLSVVVAVQMARLEKGTPVWSILAFAGGITMSMFLVFPPICWGVAAFSVDRAPEVTTLMHELSLLTLTTTDQYYIFLWLPLAYVSIRQGQDALSPFPKWYGWFTLWAAIAFEVGALAFHFKSGPFAWNGVLVFWMPLTVFFAWLAVTYYLLLKVLPAQLAAANS